MKGTSWAAQQHHERAVAHHQQLIREAEVARLLASRREQETPPAPFWRPAFRRVWAWLQLHGRVAR
ncbi:hypothetical protein [Deinococcus sp. NW-56]|uniref:hypothetical protein n=1 Tax=Deinococcus sp. NW-56 TaxID=2080419 RepID=UPI000CF3797B|nr:hypothetical protein [Deinococcus sp. NW-56]